MGKLQIKTAFIIVGILGILGVAFGALGAHALKEVLEPEQVDSFQTGVRYHLIHTVVLLVLIKWLNEKWISKAFWFFTLGIVLFSFSIYLLNLRHVWDMPGLTVLGPVTPIGGIMLMIGWGFLIPFGLSKSRD